MADESTEREPIAERHLRARRRDGTVVPIDIAIYQPVRAAEHEEYRCRYRIKGLRKNAIEETGVGVDGIQAIHLCIQAIASWMSVVSGDADVELEWSEGSAFDNLELYAAGALFGRGEPHGAAPHEPTFERDLRKTFSMMRTDPGAAEHAFKRLRRRALRRGFVHQAMKCLEGRLAIARSRGDETAVQRLVRIIAECQPSAANLAAWASELEKRERLREARARYEQALAVAEERTWLHGFLLEKLDKLRGERLHGRRHR